MKPLLGSLMLIVALPMHVASLQAAEPASRPFALGLTPMNFDATPAGTERMKRLLCQHAEIVSLYFDFGVPWPEAFEGKPFHPNAEREIAAIKQRIGPNHDVFLALNIGAFNRQDMAPYWGSEWGLPRPGRWAEKSLDDPDVIAAFGNYCERMIQAFRPKYLCYAIEINMMAGAKPANFDKVVTLASQLYPRLKKAHPELWIFPSMQRDFYNGPDDATAKGLRRLLPYSDAVAVSTYPHLRGFTAATLPADWFSALRDLAPDKSFLIAETGFPAERYVGKWYGQPISLAATPQMQRDYVRRVLTDAHRLNARFVNWFFAEDINAYLERQLAILEDPAKRAEADGHLLRMKIESPREFVAYGFNIGLSDSQHRPRPAMAEWDTWRSLPIKRPK